MDKKQPQHLSRTSASGTALSLDALYRIAPQVFTEVADPQTGRPTRKVCFTALRRLLGDDTVEDPTEAYQFTWVGKAAAKAEAARPTSKTLRPCKEESRQWDTTKNLYIEGDNLEVLKLLQRSYLGKVKMIYIDPPYNTGNDFVYHDDFHRSRAEEELAAGDIDEQGLRYRKNTETNGQYHSDWCSMIYARLLVARSLLTEDGVIFISIDDNEVENLRKICDEVFGESNFVGQWNWFKSATPPNLSKKIKKNIEYLFAYQNGSNTNTFRGVKKVSKSDDPITKPQNSLKELVFEPGTIHAKFPDGTIPAGTYGTDKFPNELLNDLIIEDGVNKNTVTFRNKFIWVQDTLKAQIENGTRINLSKSLVISYKKADYSAEVPPNFIDSSVGVGTTEEAGTALDAMFDGKHIFDYPKPVSLIQYLTGFDTPKEDAIILDFFSGSATTAHAVMQLNAEDGGNRRFIMVQLPEETAEDSEAFKAGYKTICEIGKERIRRAGDKIKADSPLTTQDLDTGFRVLKLDSSNFEEVERAPKDFTQESLSLFANNIKGDRDGLDQLFGAMLSWGVTLDLPMQTEEVDGCEIYTVNEGDLVACFSEGITDRVVEAMVAKAPLRVLFRDSCFTHDDQKINIYEAFKQQLDWTDDEAFKNIRVI